MAGHMLRADDTDPMRQVSYQPSSANPPHIGKRRVGRPRQRWVFRINETIHNRIRPFENDDDEWQNHAILEAAHARIV